jgi:hypothetical protein
MRFRSRTVSPVAKRRNSKTIARLICAGEGMMKFMNSSLHMSSLLLPAVVSDTSARLSSRIADIISGYKAEKVENNEQHEL